MILVTTLHGGAGGRVETERGKARKPLAEEGGQAPDGDVLHVVKARPEVLEVDLETVAAEGADVEKAAAHSLAHRRREGRAPHLKMQGKDEKRVERDVQDRPGHKADHGKEGVALEAELVIQDAGQAHEGRAAEDDADIIRGIGHRHGRDKPLPRDRFEKILNMHRYDLEEILK